MTVKSLLINEADRPAQRAGSPSLESAISPENPIYQGDLAGTADTAGDVSTRNDSATARADTGNIRGICSPGVPAAETAEDRLDKIEAMVTDLFRQLRNVRETTGHTSKLEDLVAYLKKRIDGLTQRADGLSLAQTSIFERYEGIARRMNGIDERLDKVESLKPFIVAAHERLDAVDEMAEQKATITDAQQIHSRINRMSERFELIRSATQHQQEAIKSVIGAAKDQQAAIDEQREFIVRLLARIGKLETAAVCDPIIGEDFEERIARLTEAVQQLQANEIERNERELSAAHKAMAAKRNHPDRPDCGNPDCGQCFEQPAPKRTIKGAWVNVYDSPASEGGRYFVRPFLSREQADDAAAKGVAPRLACIQIPDITEGEGL